jgi:mannose-1-phosphate guanylyltransferase
MLLWLARHGAKRVVLCLGVRADLVLEHLTQQNVAGLEIIPSVEPHPLGTAGALRLALPQLRSDPALVMNGDTFIDADLGAFVAGHRQSGAAASVLCANVPSTARYGRLEIADQRIQRFAEKDVTQTEPGPINAGLYLFSRRWLIDFAQSQGESLERDIFAKAPPGTFAAITADGATFIDIGTPESFAQAESVIVGAAGKRQTPTARSVA